MKRLLLSFISVLVFSFSVSADEGMWLLPYLQKVNYTDMKAKGLKISADDIYNANGSSIKDAIVVFGRGCTGEIVSSDGLIFTNHHCGYGNIQQLSSVENDYLANGFWAMSREEEIPAPGLSVYFIRSIDDVTDIVLAGTTIDTPKAEFDEIVKANKTALWGKLRDEHPDKLIDIQSFFGGNEFFASIIEEYNDVRLVGTPPSSIGKFGGETDNWMWPRHTGDFSVFRVYSAPDGSPAEYSKDNVPYHTPVHLKISAQGYKEGDFAMIMGFPGRTMRYMTTYEIDEMLEVSNPNRIYVRGERQEILKKEMAASDKVRIQYADKYALSSNYWKNSMGMSEAVVKLGVRDQKQALEDEFQAWAAADPSRVRYAQALPQIRDFKAQTVDAAGEAQYLSETIFAAIEVANISSYTSYMISKVMAQGEDAVAYFAEELYKDYDEATERKVTARMIEILLEKLSPESRPEFLVTDVIGKFGGDAEAYTKWLYDTSLFANKERFEGFIADFDEDKMNADPAMHLYKSTRETYNTLNSSVKELRGNYEEGVRLYIAGLREMQPDVMHYPDANFTLRLTYGSVLPYSPADGVYYDYYTTMKGVIEKEDPTNSEFVVPARQKELYEEADYGRYADYTGLTKKEIKNGAKGHLNTCFLTTNDITGGNSGSPVLNARGELIGLAFDGNWEALSGDVVFEKELQRCINVDVRYVLWVIDKFAGAGHLLEEMTIVW